MGSGLGTGTRRLKSELCSGHLQKVFSIACPQNMDSKSILNQKGLAFPTVNISASMQEMPIYRFLKFMMGTHH